MRTRLALFLVPLTFLIGLGLGGALPETQAQDREMRGQPTWAKALVEAIRADQATKARFEYVRDGDARLVFDNQTGCSYELYDKGKKVRIEDPVGGRIFLRRVERIDQSIGGVIRAR